MKIDNEYESVVSLLPMAVEYDNEKITAIMKRCEKENKILVAVYPGVPELMNEIDVSKMELIGSIIDGSLYLKQL